MAWQPPESAHDAITRIEKGLKRDRLYLLLTVVALVVNILGSASILATHIDRNTRKINSLSQDVSYSDAILMNEIDKINQKVDFLFYVIVEDAEIKITDITNSSNLTVTVEQKNDLLSFGD
jgi:hypothetical protein